MRRRRLTEGQYLLTVGYNVSDSPAAKRASRDLNIILSDEVLLDWMLELDWVVDSCCDECAGKVEFQQHACPSLYLDLEAKRTPFSHSFDHLTNRLTDRT
jgi:hypothetical protein